MTSLSIGELRKAIDIKEKIERLEGEFSKEFGGYIENAVRKDAASASAGTFGVKRRGQPPGKGMNSAGKGEHCHRTKSTVGSLPSAKR